MSFDTLAFAKRLAAAGMDSRQAQALAQALNDIVFDTLSTKNDLRELEVATKAGLKEQEVATKAGFKELEAKLEAGLKDLEQRLTNSLTVRTGGMIAGSTALIVAILGTLNSLS
ncbi:MAG: hypothetical protein ACXW27_06660 [Allosphingosinicella sp.]